MANPAGILNGTSVVLQVNTGSGFVNVEGTASDSDAFNRALIETTNKSSEEFRTYLANSGTKSLDTTVEALYSNDAAYDLLFQAVLNGDDISAQRVFGSYTVTVSYQVESASPSFGLNEAGTNSFSLKSNGNFTLVKA